MAQHVTFYYPGKLILWHTVNSSDKKFITAWFLLLLQAPYFFGLRQQLNQNRYFAKQPISI
jgi:hypothetical protein